MEKTIKTDQSGHKQVNLCRKLHVFFEDISTQRSHLSKILDSIPLNQTNQLNCPWSEKIE